MLVLSRRKDECIIIDDRIKIMFVDMRGDQVRLGIEAHKDVTIHREEIWEQANGRRWTKAEMRRSRV